MTPTPHSCEQTLADRRTSKGIQETLRAEGRVLVAELAKPFRASQVTIRKNLEILHSTGRIHRTHGGALPVHEGALEDHTRRVKETLHRKVKIQIATAAANMVEEGQVVILEQPPPPSPGRSAICRNLTIITNAVNIAAKLAGSALQVNLTRNSAEEFFFAGEPIAEETWRRLNADILFLGVDGFDVQIGTEHAKSLEAKVNRAMMDIARIVVAVCDSSKFGSRSLSLIAPPSAVHRTITDRRALQGRYRGHSGLCGLARTISGYPQAASIQTPS